MRKVVFWFVLLGLFTASCATTYHSGRTGKYQPFYVVSVSFDKEDVPADAADHSFILEAVLKDGGEIGTQCDRGNSDSEFVVCLFKANNLEMSFTVLQVWNNVVIRNTDNQLHVGKNVPSVNEYLCATNVKVGISANALRLNNDGSLDPEYSFFLPSDNHEPACKFKITERTMENAMETQAKK